MEFNFNAEDVLRCDQDGFTLIDGNQPEKYKRQGGGINAHRSSSFFNQGNDEKSMSPD